LSDFIDTTGLRSHPLTGVPFLLDFLKYNFEEVRVLKKDIFDGGIYILDGAIATLLFDKGMRFNDLPEDFMMRNPEVLRAIHREYRLAGADILTTNTFNLTRIIAEKLDLHDRAEEIVKCAVELARSADEAYVAGSIGPTSGSCDNETAVSAFEKQAHLIDSAGTDLIILETMTSPEEASIALKAVKSISKLPTIVSFAHQDPANTIKSALALGALKPSALGANCGGDPRDMIRTIAGIRHSWRGVICAEPSAGIPSLKNDRLIWPVAADDMAEIAVELAHAGASLIGSCCGSTPEFTAAIARVLRK